jgi:hypothetical protein
MILYLILRVQNADSNAKLEKVNVTSSFVEHVSVGGLLLRRRSSKQRHHRQSGPEDFPLSAEGPQDEDLA